jgi:acetoin utilization protein AcuB
MFAVYGISGPIFQGPLEGLTGIPPVVRRGAVAGARRIGDQLADAETFAATLAEAVPAARGEKAVNAYQEMLPKNLERGPLYLAEQIMQGKVLTLRANDDVAHAWHLLVEHQIHQAPVLDAAGRLVGIVSERNLLTTLNVDAGQVRDVLARRVSDVMTTPVVAAMPGTDIRRIAKVMLERLVDGVPIVGDNGTLLGFVSRSDILQAVVTDPPLSIWR